MKLFRKNFKTGKNFTKILWKTAKKLRKKPWKPWNLEKIFGRHLVINYKSTLGNNKNLSLKLIILKLTTLLAMLSSSRASELTYLDIRNIAFKENSVIFHFSKLIKTWEKGKSPSFELRGFEKAKLYIIRCLKQYLLIRNPLRSEEKLLIIS